MNTLKCVKCGYEWQPRVKNPKVCPECKDRAWRTGITAKQTIKNELEKETS